MKVRCPICDNNIECEYCDEIRRHEEEIEKEKIKKEDDSDEE